MLKFERLPHGHGLPLPSYGSEGASGIDICAAKEASVMPGEIFKMPTGFRIQPPDGFEVQVRARSGWASKGLGVANGVGSIDQDYRGEVFVLLVNFTKSPIDVRQGDRIAQLVLAPVTRTPIAEVDALDETNRGERGFGSTGR